MPLYASTTKPPAVSDPVFVAPGAHVVGDVALGRMSASGWGR